MQHHFLNCEGCWRNPAEHSNTKELSCYKKVTCFLENLINSRWCEPVLYLCPNLFLKAQQIYKHQTYITLCRCHSRISDLHERSLPGTKSLADIENMSFKKRRKCTECPELIRYSTQAFHRSRSKINQKDKDNNNLDKKESQGSVTFMEKKLVCLIIFCNKMYYLLISLCAIMTFWLNCVKK